MRSFFKVFFACLLALFVAGFLSVMVLFGIAASVGSSEKPVVSKQTVLTIDLGSYVAEQGREEDLNPTSLSFEATMGLRDLVGAIHHAIGDSLVKAIYLNCSGNQLGMASGRELGVALDSFKAAGKPVIAFTDMMPQRAYAIAHRASHLYMQPGGVFEWSGLFVEVVFFKNLLDRLAIKPEVFYAGRFKSATEPFRLTKMSDANRAQYQAIIDEAYRQMVVSIGKHRGIDSAALTGLANSLAVRTAEQALQHGLIDGVKYDDEVKDTLKALIGLSKKEDINFMPALKYIEATRSSGTGDRIAIVYADGNIVDGKGEDGEIGGDSFRKMLAGIRSDDKVKAVVLRVNSPGGSAIASEMIWRELSLLRKEKPLVVSMGNYAASGGYYISCVADSIFAQPNTLTGSIGVFSLLFDAKQLFNDKLGITFDLVATNTYSDFGNLARPMTEFEKQVAQRDVDSIYATFKQRVMQGRGLDAGVVDSIAQGRVWSGTHGLAIGLVDHIGGLHDALACAARMAKLKTFATREYPRHRTILDKILSPQDKEDSKSISLLEKGLPPRQAAWVKGYRSFAQMANVPQARLPFIVQFP